MTTARNIIERAHKKIHVLGVGQNLGATEAQDALNDLNDLMASLSVETGVIYNQARETFNLTGAISYTIGTGGDFNTDRPAYIDSVFITSTGGNDYDLISEDVRRYDERYDKDFKGIAENYYYASDYPLGKIYLYPVPDASYTITISSHKPLTSFASLDAVYAFPPEYKRMLINGLAIERAPNYEKEASPAVMKAYRESKHNVKIAAQRSQEYLSDNAIRDIGRGHFDIYRGWDV